MTPRLLQLLPKRTTSGGSAAEIRSRGLRKVHSQMWTTKKTEKKERGDQMDGMEKVSREKRLRQGETVVRRGPDARADWQERIERAMKEAAGKGRMLANWRKRGTERGRG